jgi:hypothetical protein
MTAATPKTAAAEMTAGTIADHAGLRTPQSLSELVAPASAEHFLRESFGKQFSYGPGEARKFAGLLPWPTLNRILRQHRLEPPRFRLVKTGKAVPTDLFLTYSSTGSHSNRIPRLRVPELTRLLRDGATLILDAVDELHEPLTALAENLERTFQAHVQINAYAGWRTSQGFDCHWDDHDVFILQVAGRKHWKIYGLTREYPLARDVEPALDPPDAPLWDGLLRAGDMLYIPRGWWHEAIPLDEPTLHLTVGSHNPTGADLLSWFIDQLRSHASLRQDLPRFSLPAEQTDWMCRIGEILREAWRPELLHEYFDYLDAMAESRPEVGLPWTAMSGRLPAADSECYLTWNVARAVQIEPRRAGLIEFCANRKRYKFEGEAAPILRYLQESGTCSLEQLCSINGSKLSRDTVRAFVRELLFEGLVSVSCA